MLLTRAIFQCPGYNLVRSRSLVHSSSKLIVSVGLLLSIALPQHNEVLVFRVHLDATSSLGGLDLNASALSADEVAKAERYLIERVRNRYVVSRLALRYLLGRMLGEDWGQIGFSYGKWGKPQLNRLLVPGLHFNVSHCEGWAAIAFSQKEIGVDLEIPRPRLKARAVLPQILTEEEQTAWRGIPAATQESEALQLWTCKEALLKAMGLGIAEGLQKIRFPIARLKDKAFAPEAISPSLQLYLDDAGDCRMTHWTDASSWRLYRLSLLDRAACAVATPLKKPRFRIRDFDASRMLSGKFDES